MALIKRAIYFCLAINLGADDTLLSALQKKDLALDREQSIIEAKKLHDSWINPIEMQYSYQKGDQYPNQLFESFSITVNQPIFKSGGIYKAILYANAVKKSSLLSVKLKERSLIFKVLELAYTYRRLKLQEKRAKLLLKNAKLDVLIKKEQFLHQELDSTYLDSAIVQKNSAALRLLELKEKIAEVKRGIKDLSDIDPDTLPLPTFSLLTKQEFMRKNLFIEKIAKDIEAKKHYKFMSIARYLPTISLFGSYTYQKMQGSVYFPDYNYVDHFYTYGVRVSMPLFDINALRNVELAKIAYLKARVGLLQAKREKNDFFLQQLQKLKIIEQKIALAAEDLALYRKLYKDTLQKYKSGEKTEYDVAIMKNSLQTKKIEPQLYAIDKQLLLLKLYKEVKDAF